MSGRQETGRRNRLPNQCSTWRGGTGLQPVRSFALLAAVAIAAPAADLRVRLPFSMVTMPLERYVAMAVAGESSVFGSDEAVKAQAVAARSYAVRLRGRHSPEGFDFCASTHCQRLDPLAVTARIEALVGATAGELCWYQGRVAFTPYSRDCGGRTEDAAALWPDLAAPYLRSHDDPHCAGGAPWQWTAETSQVLAAIRRAGLRAPARLDRVDVAERTASGRARELVLAGGTERVRVSASSFRFAVGRELGWNTVRSDRYDVRVADGRASFAGTGSGHGAGLCQRGADRMGAAGRGYREILAFYYPGSAVGLTAQGLPLQSLGGERLTMRTTRPAQDGAVLAAAERLVAEVERRTGWPFPQGVEVRVYPDVETFRNSTAEPGWVAAHTAGRRIHLQPAAVLRSRGTLDATLRHELLHVAIEARAAPALPLWFREGLVEYLTHPDARTAAPVGPPSDRDLQQTVGPARARRAYAAANAAVAALVKRHGEREVLTWVQRGLPGQASEQ